MGKVGGDWKYSSVLISQTCRSQLTSDTSLCLRDRARKHQDNTTSQDNIFITLSPCLILFPIKPCLLLSQSKAVWKTFCASQLEGGFESILLPCRESTLGIGLKRGSGAVKRGRNSSAALPEPAKNKSFPCPAEIPAWAGWQKDSQMPRRTLREKAGHCTSLLCTDYKHS